MPSLRKVLWTNVLVSFVFIFTVLFLSWSNNQLEKKVARLEIEAENCLLVSEQNERLFDDCLLRELEIKEVEIEEIGRRIEEALELKAN